MDIKDIKIGMRVACPTDWDAATTPNYTPEPNLGVVESINLQTGIVTVGDMREFDGMTTGEYEAADLELAPQDA